MVKIEMTWKELRRRFCGSQYYLVDPGRMRIIRYRGTKIPTPWTTTS